MCKWAACGILPPFISEFKDETANAHPAVRYHMRDDLAHEHCRRFRLIPFIHCLGLRIVGVGTKLCKEHWLLRRRGPLVEEGAERQAVVRGDAPEVHVLVEGSELSGPWHHAIDRCNWVRRVEALDETGHLLHASQSCLRVHASVEPVVVPLVADGPHEDGRVVPELADGGHDAGSFPVALDVYGVHDVDTPPPEGVQHLRVCERLVRANSIDAGSRHQLAVGLHKATKVHSHSLSLLASNRDRIPVHALQAQGPATSEDAAAFYPGWDACSLQSC
mmetsp:Transcript_23373/g.66595  ORF Transcript_23373/g.66595 Transcript_23373/m.66595 type:complete len:276 (+) Transcript_23373:975-1802(+)